MADRYYGRSPKPARRREIADEVTQELDFHLEMRTREYIARGLSPADARDRALARFGDLARVKQTCRAIGTRRDTEMRRREYFSELRQDAAFATRQLVANPGFSLVAILTLALGIGATTAIFSAVNAVVLRPLPVEDPSRLVFVTESWRGQPSDVSAGNFVDMMGAQSAFTHAAALQYTSLNLSGDNSPERVVGARVTHGFFDLFAIPPAIGRVFRADEDQPGSEAVVVLSHQLWTRRFGSDPSIVGKDIKLGGRPHEVVGVMPPHFSLRSDREELWVPIAFTPERKAMHDEHYLTVIARLKNDVTIAQAESQLKTIADSLRTRFPRDNAELGFRVLPFTETFVGENRNRLLVLLGAVGLVLLIACGNVANLLLARGATRGRELAIRAALGAGRGRIIRQLLTESAVLALVAGAAGLALASWSIRTLVAMAPAGVPRLDRTEIDTTVLAFTLGVSVFCSLVFGMAPALRAARASVSETLKEGGRGQAGTGRDWLRSALIAAEVGLAVLLLAGAGLLIRSAIELSRVKPGFDPAGVLTVRLTLPADEYRDPARVVATFERIADEARQAPGVVASAITSQVPLGPGGNGNGLIPDGKPFDIKHAVQSRLRMISPGFFDAMRIPILRGRGFDARDRRGAQKVMIVSETLAAALFPGQDSLGRGVACCEPGPDGKGPDYKVIVGIAGDVRGRALGIPPQPDFYLPIAQVPREAWDWTQRSMTIVVRAAGDPMLLLPHLRSTVAAIDPDVPLFNVKTMEERMADSLATARFNTLLLTLLGAIGLVLAAIGIYGVIAYFVTQRTPEIGVRMALGATGADVTRLVLGHAATPIGIGLVAGMLASLAATRALSAQLVGVEPTDPATLTLVVLALALAALVAALVPARRAAALDPTQALLH